MEKNQAPVLQLSRTYTITYRQCKPNSDYCFTKDYTYTGTETDILLALKYTMGHYGGLKAELIKEEKI